MIVMPEYVGGENTGHGRGFGAMHQNSAVCSDDEARMIRVSSETVNSGYSLLMPRSPKPGGVIVEPRSFTDNPKKFGNTSTRLQPGAPQSPQHAAAELQHVLTNAIREYLLDHDQSLKSFCEATPRPAGLTLERFYRISNGTTMMGLTDIMFWAAYIPGLTDTLHETMNRLVPEPGKPGN